MPFCFPIASESDRPRFPTEAERAPFSRPGPAAFANAMRAAFVNGYAAGRFDQADGIVCQGRDLRRFGEAFPAFAAHAEPVEGL